MAKKKYYDIYKPYWALAALRISLVFLQQNGYIHPDEFFQSIEILIGKFFEVETNKPWEFKTNFPIRSMTIPYFVLGFSYQLLKLINRITYELYQIDIVNPYTLIVFPRLVICSLSFLVDYSVYKICVNNNEKYKSKLVILASSYVMIVFGIRSFSNTFELLLFALLLYFVAESMTYSNMLIRHKEFLNRRYEKCKTPIDKAKIHKLRLYLNTHSLRNCFYVSTLCVAGFFNRPTFLVFAVCPVFFWLYRGLGTKSVISLHFHLRIIIILLCSFPSILFFVFVDSMFYGYLTWAEIEFFTLSINNFVFTPLNFFKYNINSNNLAEHGLHPRYLHFLVNIPLLFNILAVYTYKGLIDLLMKCIKRKIHLLPTVRSIKGLMICSFITPLVLLSIVPHQEPRFLIPVIVPLIYLYGNCILEESDYEIVEVTKDSLTISYMEKIKQRTRNRLKTWFIFNIILLLFYGYIHQGGLLQVTSYLEKEMREKPPDVGFNIFTSHVYSIPESLFLQRSTEKIYRSRNTKFKVKKRVKLYEEGSKELNFLLQKASTLTMKNLNLTYVILPSSLRNEFEYLVSKDYSKLFIPKCINFYPHLSTEALPDLNVFVTWFANNNYKTFRTSDVVDNILYVFKNVGLALCLITRIDV